MPNAKDATASPTKRILFVGDTGNGKSAQLWTLPGRKFLYLFDPNTIATIGKRGDRPGLDIDYEEFLPDITELDFSLKGFNKGARSDRMADNKKREPKIYQKWVENLNEKGVKGFFNDFDWLCIDSLTFLAKACMQRQLFINGRYGDLEELADYRVVGSKLTSVFDSICSTDINIYMTGHIDKFVNEKTKAVETLIRSPGSSRGMLPLIFTDIWSAERGEDARGNSIYQARTMPDPRGLKSIRCSMSNVPELVDVSISDFPSSKGGIGAMLAKYNS